MQALSGAQRNPALQWLDVEKEGMARGKSSILGKTDLESSRPKL